MTSDRGRQVGVTASFIVAIFGTLLGIGVIGTRVQESAGGALAADATLLSPAVQAFSIWSVIYLGLTAYVVWQWLPRQTTSELARVTGWWAAASLLLNAAWLGVTQVGWLWVSVLVILALAYVLGRLCRELRDRPAANLGELIVVHLTFGLYLGWVCLATIANITSAAVASGVEFGQGIEAVVAIVVLIIAAALGMVLARSLSGQVAIGVAMAWGLAWIAVGRITDEPRNVLVGAAAVVSAVIVLGAHLARARRSPR